MPKLVFIILVVLGLVGCSTNYKLKDSIMPIKADADSLFECSSVTNLVNEKNPSLCKSFGFESSVSLSCNSTEGSCIRIHVKETARLLDVSPAMIFFLGLIPSNQYYFYEVEITQTNHSGSEKRSREEFEIIESWGTLNTFQRFFSGLNTKENEHGKIGSFIKGKYGNRI